jgi:ADP-ribose pyrophosphatase YjhB (NUDIX family)
VISHRHASSIENACPIEQTCPVVTRQHQCHCEILAFDHPQAGHQFVKGTTEPGESAAAAARRDLREQAGITAVKTTIVLG